MKCEKIREIILTDYLDGQLGRSGQEDIALHLSQCPACSAFALKAKQATIEPFAQHQPCEPPADLWQEIKSALGPKQERSALKTWAENLLRIIFQPRPIFALSSTLAVILIGLVLIGSPQFFHRLANQRSAETYLQDQAEFFASDSDLGLNGGLDAEIYSAE